MAALSDLRTRFTNRFHDPNNIFVQTSEINDYLNDAYFEFIAEADWFVEEELITLTTTADSRTVPLPSDVFRVFGVRNKDEGYKLYPLVGYRSPYELYPDPEDYDGEPIRYRTRGDVLELFPTPDSSYTLELVVSQEPDPLSADADVPILPQRYHRALVDGALARAYMDSEPPDVQRASAYQKFFSGAIQQAIKELTSIRSERYPQIHDDFYTDGG